MKRIALTPAARDDLSDIRSYTIKVWGFNQAEFYLASLGALFRNLAEGAKISQTVGRGNYRKARFRSHMIYFAVSDDEIEIVRVLHVSMDAERHLPNP